MELATVEVDRSHVMLSVLLYSCMWCTLYFIFCLVNYKRSYEWNVRIVTAIHAIVVTAMSAWCAFVQGPWPFTDAGGRNTPLQQSTICVCLGYFLFDLTWCLYYQTEGPSMLIHHILSIMGLSVCVLSGCYGTEMIGSICGSEISNPLLQLRWFLRETGKYNTILGEIVDLAFMFMFGGIRIGIGSYLLYCYFQQDTDVLGRIGGVALYVLSWVFMVNILGFAYKKYTRKFREWMTRRNKTQASDRSEVVTTGSKDDNHNLRIRKLTKNGLITSKNIQNKLVGSDDVIEFSVNRADIITS